MKVYKLSFKISENLSQLLDFITFFWGIAEQHTAWKWSEYGVLWFVFPHFRAKYKDLFCKDSNAGKYGPQKNSELGPFSCTEVKKVEPKCFHENIVDKPLCYHASNPILIAQVGLTTISLNILALLRIGPINPHWWHDRRLSTYDPRG